MTTLRQFPFDVRPRHRETLDSYTRRLLTANSEPATLRGDLVRQEGAADTGKDSTAVWLDILTRKTKRDELHMEPHATGWCTHADGDGCEFCIDQISRRWMCTHCAHGATIEQYPHFDSPVCERHLRWVGLFDRPEAQHHVTPEHAHASRAFERLRKRHRIDTRFYQLLRDGLTLGGHRTESAAFPDLVAVATAITDTNFTKELFNPAVTYADAFALLCMRITGTLGSDNKQLNRAIWLYLRPTFADLRDSIIGGHPFTPRPHDFPLQPAVAASFQAGRETLEPFPNYLKVTGDGLGSAMVFATSLYATPDALGPAGGQRPREVHCHFGHKFSAIFYGDKRNPEKCPVCRHRQAQTGHNDLQTLYPKVAAEFNIEFNGGLTPSQVPAHSNIKYFWRCPHGHDYQATPANRTLTGSRCPVCMNRLVVPGVNDLATTHPEVAAEWHPGWHNHLPPTHYSAGSHMMAAWLCAEGHFYRRRINDRVTGKGCDRCRRATNRASLENITQTHPAVAAEWHPEKNGNREPADYTRGSQEKAYWLCPVGHTYWMRIDWRTRGFKCSVCSRRTLVPKVNDLATTDPVLVLEWHSYLNWKEPSKTFAGTDPVWWRCLAERHEYQQSVPNRRKSQGCPLCPKDQRILVTRS